MGGGGGATGKGREAEVSLARSPPRGRGVRCAPIGRRGSPNSKLAVKQIGVAIGPVPPHAPPGRAAPRRSLFIYYFSILMTQARKISAARQVGTAGPFPLPAATTMTTTGGRELKAVPIRKGRVAEEWVGTVLAVAGPRACGGRRGRFPVPARDCGACGRVRTPSAGTYSNSGAFSCFFCTSVWSCRSGQLDRVTIVAVNSCGWLA